MARGAHLTPEVKKLIAEIHRVHTDYGPKKIREELLRRMKEASLDKNFGPDWPSVSSVSKVMTDIRSKHDAMPPESKRLDSPWSLGYLVQYPIPPEALPTVMSVYKTLRSERRPLRIREALWIGRLYKIIDPPDLVYDWARQYAFNEMISEDLGISPETTSLDPELIRNPYYASKYREKSPSEE